MSSPPLPLWHAAAGDATFTDPAACAARADAFARQIARRNRRERWAAYVQLPVWGALAAFFAARGEALIAAALVLIALGLLAVLANLARRATNLPALPEEPCLAHLARQYRRQHAALRAVPRWYLAPLLPGIAGFYAAVTARVAERAGWSAALEGVLWPFAVTFGLFAIVLVLNRLAARALAAELARIEALCSPPPSL
ncbi:hypothetical protein [Erythrobacter cryptus]|uniref:hypothetical protein n=1 Tax=Erythrobacter cryptus TaxID=196588 RepID=UPI00040016E5|nr:hypothetical protein [Erythrobacter cryptus]GIX18400.1 MAG: hypothetical protein KatS3mg120_0076 [Erythrobacter sp.]